MCLDLINKYSTSSIFEDLKLLTVEDKKKTQLRFKTPKYFHVRGEHKNFIYSSSHGTLMRLKSEFV